MKKISLLLLLLVLSSSPTMGAEGEDFFFTISDPVADDYGPGYYQYPGNKVFQEGEGLFDLVNFSIKGQADFYTLKFDFKKLTDPWQSRFGFSLPLIQLYIDNQEGGSTELFKEGANVRLHEKYPWDIHIQLSGWWIRAYRPQDRDVEDINFWEAEENPWDITEALVETKDNSILVRLPQELIGDLEGAYLYLLIGGFDPFGPDYFRTLSPDVSSWQFSSSKEIELETAPRVIDLLLPSNLKQEEVLAAQDSFPLIYPVRIPKMKAAYTAYFPHLILLLFILLFLLFIMNKKGFFSHTI